MVTTLHFRGKRWDKNSVNMFVVSVWSYSHFKPDYQKLQMVFFGGKQGIIINTVVINYYIFTVLLHTVFFFAVVLSADI